MKITLNQPNTTSTAKVLIIEASSDITNASDPTKPLALTKVLTQDKQPHTFWHRDNRPLGKTGDVVDIVVTTEDGKRDNGDYYHSVYAVPTDFFTA